MRSVVVVLLVVAARSAAADCVEAPGSGREIELPASWTAGKHKVYAEADVFSNATLGDGCSIAVFPPDAGMTCAQAGLRNAEADETFSEGPRTQPFSNRWSRFWVEAGEDMISGVSYLACKDTARGAVEVRLIIDPSTEDPVDATNPAFLQITEAVADMVDFDVQCPWEPQQPVVTAAPTQYVEDPHDVILLAGLGGISGMSGSTTSDGVALIDIDMSLHRSIVEFGFYARGGAAFSGGAPFDLALRAGFGGGKHTHVAVVLGVGTRGVSGDRIRTGLSLQAATIVMRPITPRYRARAVLDLAEVSTITKSMVVGEPSELSPFALEVGGTLLVQRGWLALGVDARAVGDAFLATLVVGAWFHED